MALVMLGLGEFAVAVLACPEDHRKRQARASARPQVMEERRGNERRMEALKWP